MSNITCCIGCTDRKLFCHSNCDKYKNEKALHEATQTIRREAKERENIYNTYHAKVIWKSKRK